MFTHSFQATSPPARFDAIPWTRVLIEESADGLTGWTQISSQALTPDATPDTPNPVNLTVTTATRASEWFRFRFDVNPSNPSTYTEAILSPAAEVSVAWAPSTRDVAALMFSRVTGEYGRVAAFTETTRPSLDQVTGMLGAATGHLAASIGTDLTDARLVPAARFMATLYTALLLEPGYWPEQSPDKSAWEQWKQLYDDGMLSLLLAIKELGAGEAIGPEDDRLKPIWAFPATPIRVEW